MKGMIVGIIEWDHTQELRRLLPSRPGDALNHHACQRQLHMHCLMPCCHAWSAFSASCSLCHTTVLCCALYLGAFQTASGLLPPRFAGWAVFIFTLEAPFEL